MRRLALLAGFAVVFGASVEAAALLQTAGRMRITAASNVRLRISPSVEVAIAASLPLGADLVELGTTPNGEWVRVRTTEGTEGWISEPLTKAVPPGERLRVIEEIAAERTRGSHGFDAAVELTALIEGVQSQASDPGQRARLALYRLKALKDAAWSTALDGRTPPDVEAWFKSRPQLFIHNHFGGLWMLRHDAIMAEHEKHRGTAAAPEIAWLAAANGIPSDCETDLGCAARVANTLDGTYLRHYPRGPMVSAAFRRLMTWAIVVRSVQQNPRDFVAARDCAALRQPLAELQAAVTAAVPIAPDVDALKGEVLRLLNLITQPCSG